MSSLDELHDFVDLPFDIGGRQPLTIREMHSERPNVETTRTSERRDHGQTGSRQKEDLGWKQWIREIHDEWFCHSHTVFKFVDTVSHTRLTANLRCKKRRISIRISVTSERDFSPETFPKVRARKTTTNVQFFVFLFTLLHPGMGASTVTTREHNNSASSEQEFVQK